METPLYLLLAVLYLHLLFLSEDRCIVYTQCTITNRTNTTVVRECLL